MSLGNRGFDDKKENYCDPYVLKINGSSATSLNGYAQPLAVFGLSITVNPSVASGLVDLVDSSATGNADPTVWSVAIASGTQPYQYRFQFPRGLACTAGLVVTATTVTGSVSVLYKSRYS